MNKTLYGFTLVELSIVMVIIGLIVAGITSINAFRARAKLRSLIVELETYRGAFEEFKDRYQAVPGDMINATDYWSGATNGNGDGLMGGNAEIVGAWNHIGATGSGILKESYTGTLPIAVGTSVPASKSIDGGGFLYSIPGAIIYGYPNANMIEFAPLTPQEAYYIDLKIDDGQADKGRLFVLRGYDFTAVVSKCVGNPYTSASAGGYVFSDTTLSCRIYYWLEKSFTNL
jgi:prepilin-type N-terminal cleavage/methylation domain-containing protein